MLWRSVNSDENIEYDCPCFAETGQAKNVYSTISEVARITNTTEYLLYPPAIENEGCVIDIVASSVCFVLF